MRFLLIFCCFYITAVVANDDHRYDAELAQRLGADEYGMKTYVLVILVSGTAKDLTETQTQQAFSGHFSNMSRLAEEGKLVVAGPFIDAKSKRGLFIFNTDSLEDAHKWVKSDPAVNAGILDYQLDKIYSSAALMMVNETHPSIAQKSVN